MDPVSLFINSYDYGIVFLDNLPVLFPNFTYSIEPIYLSGVILELLSSKGANYIKDPGLNQNIIDILTSRINDLREYFSDSYVDIITSLSDDLIDILTDFDDTDQINIINNAITTAIQNESNLYDTSGLNIILDYLEPYVRDEINNRDMIPTDERNIE